jgi:hypothetical protein
VDTGSAQTVIAAGLIDDLGYSPRQGEQVATIRLAEGRLLVDRVGET